MIAKFEEETADVGARKHNAQPRPFRLRLGLNAKVHGVYEVMRDVS